MNYGMKLRGLRQNLARHLMNLTNMRNKNKDVVFLFDAFNFTINCHKIVINQLLTLVENRRKLFFRCDLNVRKDLVLKSILKKVVTF